MGDGDQRGAPGEEGPAHAGDDDRDADHVAGRLRVCRQLRCQHRGDRGPRRRPASDLGPSRSVRSRAHRSHGSGRDPPLRGGGRRSRDPGWGGGGIHRRVATVHRPGGCPGVHGRGGHGRPGDHRGPFQPRARHLGGPGSRPRRVGPAVRRIADHQLGSGEGASGRHPGAAGGDATPTT